MMWCCERNATNFA